MMSNILQTDTSHARARMHTRAREGMSQPATLQILAELRRRLWLAEGEEMSAESRALYTHIEKTLLTALSEYYGTIKEDNAGDRDHSTEPQRGHD